MAKKKCHINNWSCDVWPLAFFLLCHFPTTELALAICAVTILGFIYIHGYLPSFNSFTNQTKGCHLICLPWGSTTWDPDGIAGVYCTCCIRKQEINKCHHNKFYTHYHIYIFLITFNSNTVCFVKLYTPGDATMVERHDHLGPPILGLIGLIDFFE